MLDILINKLKYYTINEQTNIRGNTPLHLAVQNKADKAVLFLILNGADKNIKNNKKFTPLESIKDDKNIDKKWKAKVKKILNGKIKDYTELDSCNFDKILKNEENIKLTEKINLMNGNIKKEYNKKEENKKKGNKKENKKEIKKIKKEMDKLTFGISTNSKLRELFFDISNNIKIQNINLDKLIEKYDKTNSGVINNDDFNDLIKNLNIENIDLTDIDFLKSFLKRDKDENILYKDFIDLVKN
jgi:ankyrin repeat protein